MEDSVPVEQLQLRVAALEKVLAIERRLRTMHKAGAAPRPVPAQDDVTVLYRPPVTNARPARCEAPAPLVLAPGISLFEYRIDAVLGQGGFGVTYLATDVHLNAKVAIKEYLPTEIARRSDDKSVSARWPEDGALYQHGLDNFLVEARTLASFRHPNIVRVARFFEANRTAYIVLEYERGKSLKQWWSGCKDVGEAELLGLLQPLLDGLALVHRSGFLHRDIKPDNIYRRKDDGSLVLLDFGAARLAAGHGGALENVVTPGYAPPEQYASGAQGPWTDIYALGATLYWMISGAKPPAAPLRADGTAMASAREAGLGRYSEVFLGAVDWALAIDPAARPQDLHAWSQTLFAAHAGSLALRDALQAGQSEPRFGNLSLRALLDSPRLLRRWLWQSARALIHPASWPMAVKMTLALVAAALLPMLMTGYYNLNGSVAAVTASELRNLERIAQSTAGRAAQLLNDSQHLANYMATDIDFRDYLRQPDAARRQVVKSKLEKLVATNPDVHLMFLMNAGGLALVSSEANVAGNDYRFRDYFKQAVQGRAFKTGIIVGATDGKRGMYYANPVFDGAGKVAGVLVLRIKASTIVDVLDAATAGTGRVPFMIDGDGVLIHHPDSRHLHRSLDTLPALAQQRIAADRRFAKPKVESLGMPGLARALIHARLAGHVSYLSTLTGDEQYAGYAPVAGQDWVVGVTESRRTFEAPLNRLFSNVLHSVAAVGVLFLVLAVYFARSIVRPIMRLTLAADALKQGDYERANIKVSTDDEIGRLARTFNVMIDVLRQRERERRRHPAAEAEPGEPRHDGM